MPQKKKPNLRLQSSVQNQPPPPAAHPRVEEAWNERRQAGQPRQAESDERFASIFRSSQVGINIFRLADGRSLDVNTAFLHMTGYTREELLGHTAEELNLLADPQQRKSWMQSLERDGFVTAHEAAIRTKSGDIRHGLFSIESFTMNGETFGVVLNVDITERYQAEHALLQSQARYQQLFENSGAAVLIIDENGQYLLVNKIAAQKFGTTPDQVVGKSMFDFLARDQAQHYLGLNRQLLLSGGHREYEDTFQLPGGERTFLIIDQCLQDELGRNFAIQSSSIEITERKLAEDALEASEIKIRTLFNTMSEGVALNQAVYNDDGKIIDYRILEVNPAFYQVADFKPGEAVGKLATQLYGMDSAFIQTFWETHKGDRAPIRSEMLSPINRRNYFISTSPIQNDTFVTSFVDITDLKQKEAALQASEQKLRTLFDTMSEGVALNQIVYDEKGEMVDYRILEVNQAFHQVADYHPGEVIGNVATQLYGMSLETIQAFWKTHKTATETAHTEFVSPLNNRTFYVSTSQFKDDTFVTTFVDIGERKQMEDALRKNESNLDALISNTTDRIFAVDAGYRLVIANAQFLGFMAGSAGHRLSVGETVLYDGLPREVSARWRGYYDRALNGESFSVESKKRDLDNPPFTEYSFHPIRNADGSITGVVVSGHDITDRVRTEVVIQESEERLRSIFTSSPDSIMLVDLRGNIQLCNQATADSYGYSSPEQLGGKSFYELVDEADHPRAVAGMQQVLQQGTMKDVPFNGVKRSGEKFPAELSVSLIKDTAGRPAGFVGITKDVTARKQAEAALLQKMNELERFQRLTVGRELKMIEMKKEINALLVQSGQPPRYPEPAETGEIHLGNL